MQPAATENINFEIFPYRKGRPSITINSQHKISFNKGAWYALGQCEMALLKFDPGNKVIGIEPCKTSDRRAFPVRRHSANNAYMYAKPFLDHYGLKVKKTTQYAAELVDGELVVRL